MAKEPEKSDKEKAPEKAVATPEEEAAKAKKKKLIMFGAIGFLVVAGGAAGAFMFLGKGSSKPADAHGEPTTETTEGGHGEAAGDAKGEAKHGEEKKADDHGAKPDAHGAKDEGHGGEKKVDAHGAPVDEHGAPKAGDGHGDTKKEEGPAYKGDFGLIKEFKPFHLNLGNPLENRYVRVSIGVEYKNGPDQLLELDRREPQLRDAVVSIISRKTREHLLSPDGKDQLRLEVKNKLNQYLDMKVDNVFITDILIE